MNKSVYQYSKTNPETNEVVKVTKVVIKNSRGEKFIGIAKCDPRDEFDPNVGITLAEFRAKERCLKSESADLSKLMAFYERQMDRIGNDILKTSMKMMKIDKSLEAFNFLIKVLER